MKTTPLFVPAFLLLAGCTPTATDAPSAPTAAMAETNGPSAPTPSSAPPTVRPEPAPTASSNPRAAEPANASISGAIRNGSHAPPALRVCASPVDGGTPTCIDTPQGASEYRIGVGPGRYHVLGWARSGEVKLIAHASQIRCIRAPCPPDELIEVDVAAGQQRTSIDLNGAYVEIPDGWPKQPD